MTGLHLLQEFFRGAWQVLVLLVILTFGLFALWRALEAGVGMTLGGSGLTGRAVWGIGALAVLGLVGLTLVPALVAALSAQAGVAPPACAGPLPALVQQTLVWAAWAVVALTGLRLLWGVLEGMVGVGLGGSAAGTIRILLEGVGVLLLLGLATPLAGAMFC